MIKLNFTFYINILNTIIKFKDTFYILEINYFPSYRELGNKINSEMEKHILKYYNKFKVE